MSLKLVALAAKLENEYAALQADNERLREALQLIEIAADIYEARTRAHEALAESKGDHA